MTRLSMNMNLMIAAATLVAAAGSASAQNLKADIPFTFRTEAGIMEPGTYDIHVGVGASRYIKLDNRDTRRSAVIAQYALSDPAKEAKAAGRPTLRFHCVNGSCSLLDLWTGTSAPAYVFPHRPSRDEVAEIREVHLTSVKAD